MNIFKHRFIFCYSLCLLALCAVLFFLPRTAKGYAFCGFLALFALSLLLAFLCRFVFWKRRFRAVLKAALCLAGCVAISLSQYLYAKSADVLEKRRSNYQDVIVLVEDVSYSAEGFCYATGTLRSWRNEPTSTRVTLTIYKTEIAAGDVLQGKGYAETLSLSDEDSSSRYLLSRGIRYSITLSSPTVVGHERSLALLGAELRHELCTVIKERVGEENGALLNAIFLGDRSTLSDSLERDMGRIGIAHMLALSGLHLSILMFGTERLLGVLGVDKRIRYALLALLILFYLFLTGGSVSALRAGCMMLLMILAFALGQQHDSISALAFAVLLICLCEPYAIIDTSLQLSALATFGILLVTQADEKRVIGESSSTSRSISLPRRIAKGALSICKLTLAATVATIPVTAFSFGYLQLLAPLGNLLFALLLEFLLFGAIIVLAFGWIPPISFCVSLLCDGTEALASLLSRIPHTLLAINPPFLAFVMCSLCAVLFLLYAGGIHKKLRVRATAAAFLAAALLIGSFHSVQAISNIDTLRVGCATTSDMTGEFLILEEGESATVIDATQSKSGESNELFPTLKEFSIFELDRYVLTGYHEGSAASVEKLLTKQRIHQLFLPLPRAESETEIALAIEQAAQVQSTAVTYYARNEQLLLGEVRFVVHEHTLIGDESPLQMFSIYYGTHHTAYFSWYEIRRYGENYLAQFAATADTVFFGSYGVTSAKRNFAYDDFSYAARAFAHAECYLPFSRENEDAPFSPSTHQVRQEK